VPLPTVTGQGKEDRNRNALRNYAKQVVTRIDEKKPKVASSHKADGREKTRPGRKRGRMR